MLRKVNVSGLALDPASKTPIVILKSDDDRTVPIWIGLLEATSIAYALQDVSFDRPMTHDLFKNFITSIQYTVERIEICDLKDNTFYAKIHFKSGENSLVMDARPSDAIAIALRFDAPIFIDESVIEKAEIIEGPGEVMDETEEGKKLAEYLEKLSPEDFGKYKI